MQEAALFMKFVSIPPRLPGCARNVSLRVVGGSDNLAA
jgi:hypothetical protein